MLYFEAEVYNTRYQPYRRKCFCRDPGRVEGLDPLEHLLDRLRPGWDDENGDNDQQGFDPHAVLRLSEAEPTTESFSEGSLGPQK